MKFTMSALHSFFSRKAILPRRRGRESFRPRSLMAERLETRAMLAADALSAWQNPDLPADVNADGYVTAMDALRVVNELNVGGPRQLTGSPAPAISRFSFMAAGEEQTAFLDVNGDNLLNSLDALVVINKLNAAQGEQVRFRIEVTDLNGNPVENLLPGQEFQLRGFVKDLREPQDDPQRGVFSAYVDVQFDAAKVMADLDGRSITYGDPADPPNQSLFPGGHRIASQIIATAGKLEDIGAFAVTQPYGSQEEIIFVVPMQVANDAATGLLSFVVEDDMTNLFDTTVFGSNQSVPANEIIFVGDQVAIGFGPTATADTATVLEDSENNTINVLANDLLAPGATGPLTVVDVTQGANGAVAIAADAGSVRYTPVANFFGEDTFTYTVEDADGNQATGTVTVMVTAANDPPTANDDTATVRQDSENNTINVLANDSITPDVGETLRVLSVSQGSAGGMVAISSGGQAISYTPLAGFAGTETFSYVVSDRPDANGSVDMATVTVTVTSNDPLAETDFATVAEDSQNNAIDVLVNDELAPGVEGALLIVDVSATNATSMVSIAPDAKSILYTPAPNFAGTELLEYRIVDGQGGEATGMVVVTVTNVNDAPNANNDAFTVNENTSANPLNVLANDTTAPDSGEVLTITAVSVTSERGMVTIASSGTALEYTPEPGFVGQDAFTYTVSDGNGLADTATVIITVAMAPDLNANPIAADDEFTVAEDSTGTPLDVLENDSDPDAGDTLTIIGVSDGSRGGMIELSGTSMSLIYTPAPNVFGDETFSYTISDGRGGMDTATVTIHITSVNDAPTAVDDTITINEDAAATPIDVLDNDTDPDEDTLTITAKTDPANGMVTISPDGLSVIYTPAANFNGTDTFTYTISDGNGGTDTAMVTVTVASVNDAPTAVDDAITINEDAAATQIDVLDNDTDAEEDALTITDVSDPANGVVTISPDGLSVIYTPAGDFIGTDTFTYTIDDGNGGSDTATVTVTVLGPLAPQTGSLSGFVYVDSNGNGVKDGAEQPLSNVTIRLWGTDVLGRPVNTTTTTDASGAYRFADLTPGSYVIEQTQPAGFVDGVESLGTAGGTAGHDQFFLALGAAQNGMNYNFGERGLRTGVIGRPDFFRP